MAARAGVELSDILDTASRIADKDGLENLTVASIASEVGVQPASLYHHVQGVAGIKRELSILGMQLMADNILSATSGLSKDDALWAVANAIRDFSKAHPGLYEATIPSAAPDDAEKIKIGDSLFDVIRTALRGYGFSGDDEYHLVRSIKTAIHGFIAMEMDYGYRTGVDVEDTWRRIIAIQVLAVRNWSKLEALSSPAD